MEKEERITTVGQMILDRLEAKGIMKSKLAEELGVSRQTINGFKTRKDIPIQWLLHLRDKYGIDLITEGIQNGTATIHKLDSDALSRVFEPEQSYEKRKTTTISLTLEIDEFDSICIPGDIQDRVKELLKKLNIPEP